MNQTITVQHNNRIIAIDVLRGLVMIVMALDHTRDFFHLAATQFDPLNLQQTSVPIFLTRWITHFCAPIFIFLAGTSAGLTLERKGKKRLSKFLFSRGVWLVLLELTVVNFGFSFNQIVSVIMLQTIWAIGVSMMALSALLYLPKKVLLAIALVIIFGHNLLDGIQPAGNAARFVWSLLHSPNLIRLGNFNLLVAYPVLPWIGVMCAGYVFASVFTVYTGDKRRRILLIIGLLCIVIFVLLRYSNVYGDPSKWATQKSPVFTLLSFINTTKYPPSLLYILMTLGPAILFLAFFEKPLNNLTAIIAVYGRVPMFYYILHIYVIHVAFVIVAALQGFTARQIFDWSILNPLQGFGVSLFYTYIIWIILVALQYPLCKKYDAYKTSHRYIKWLSYL